MLDWSECPIVERDPEKLKGAPVLRGTRMPVDAIIDNYDDGMSADEISEQFEIPQDQVEAVLAFVAKSRSFAGPIR
jgi:uncharacterized protein (DUF433 family)